MTTKIDRYCIDGYGLPEVMANEAWVRYVDHFSFVKDLLAKQAGMVLVSVKDLEELVDSWNGGDVKSASMYEAVKYFEGLIVEAK